MSTATNTSPILARSLPFAAFIAILALQGMLTDAAWFPQLAGNDLRWLHGLRALLVAALLAWFWRHYTELHTLRGIPLRHWLAAAVVGALVFVLWIALDQPWASMETTAGMEATAGFNPLRADGHMDWPLLAVRVLGIAVLVPVMEELFWRSFLLRWIDRPDFLQMKPAAVSAKAFWITAVLFALEHNLWLAGLLAGVAYNLLYMRTGNLWLPIFAHAVTNALLASWIVLTASWHLW